MSGILSPRESGQFIMKYARYVRLNHNALDKLVLMIVAGLKNKTIDISNYSQNNLHPKPSDAKAVEWICVADTLNFCFWTPENHPKYTVQGHHGYFALCAALNRALANGIDITNPEFYSKVTKKTLEEIFLADDGVTKIPLLDERLECLHEVGEILMEKWGGRFENVVTAAMGSAKKLRALIVREFPCFRDEADYALKRVSFYKRAQILIGDLWACYRGTGLGAFSDMECITVFPDYRIPQVLIHLNVLEIQGELEDVLKYSDLMQHGDRMEVELRGASIYAVELAKSYVKDEIEELHPDLDKSQVNSVLIDNFLWDYRRAHAREMEKTPFHKVKSIYY